MTLIVPDFGKRFDFFKIVLRILKYKSYIIIHIICLSLFQIQMQIATDETKEIGYNCFMSKLYRVLRWIYHHTFKVPPKSLGYVFMLHRVDEFEDGHLWCNEHMKVTPDFLDNQIKLLKKKYDIISIKELPSRLNKKQKRKFIVFTMDDGYKDNYTKALPVFKKNGVPFTIFVTTNFPEHKAILWWYELEDILLKNDSLTLGNGKRYSAVTYDEKCDAFLKIREEILKLNQLDLENELNKLFSNYKINWTKKCKTLCMSWDDIKKLKNEPLVNIGAHTNHHYNLMQLNTEDDVKREVMEGVNLLKQKACILPQFFAYPFGSSSEAGKREYKVLSTMPFECAFIAYGGGINKNNKKELSSLPRIMFTQKFNIKDLECSY